MNLGKQVGKIFKCRVIGCRYNSKHDYDLCRWHWVNVPPDMARKFVDRMREGTDSTEFRYIVRRIIEIASSKPIQIPERIHKVKPEKLL
jgi:hypothetical protein